MRRLALVVSVLAIVGACSGGGGTNSESESTTTAPPSIDDTLRLNEIQVLGSHNSYHTGLPDDVMALLTQFSKSAAESLDYEHGPLADQFGKEGVRQIELDVFADPDGGLFADRHIHVALSKPIPSGIPELDQPGFKVLHESELDMESVCVTFVECLHQVKDWSDANPTHLPIMILVEAKEDPTPDPANMGFVTPHLIRGPELDALDDEIRSVFSAGDMITPDDVRGSHKTLREAVLDTGWPTLADSRGKVLFSLDNENITRDSYLDGHPSLEGRLLFTSNDPASPAAAFVKLNDPVEDGAKIAALVKQGFIIRTRADADTVQARTNDVTMRDAALASGAQYVSSDYLTPDTRFSDYKVELPGGEVARCNPVNAPANCKDADIKP